MLDEGPTLCFRISTNYILLFSHSVVSISLLPHVLQHSRLLCPSPSHEFCSNSGPLSQWCHPTTLFSVIPFSSCPQSFPASQSFPMSGIRWPKSWSFSFSNRFPMNNQGWFPLGLTDSWQRIWIKSQMKRCVGWCLEESYVEELLSLRGWCASPHTRGCVHRPKNSPNPIV